MKKIVSVFVIITIMLSLAACGVNNKTGENTSKNEEVTINYYGKPNEKGFETYVIEEFSKQYPNINVNYVELGEDGADKLKTIQTLLQTGDSSMDVFVGDVVWTSMFAGAGFVQEIELTEEERAEHTKGSMDAYTISGKTFGIPFYTNSGMLYWRQDLLDKYGKEVPKTWEELEETTKYIAEQEEGIDGGFAGSWHQTEGLTCNVVEYIWSHGGVVIDDEGKVRVNSPETLSALTTIKKLYDNVGLTGVEGMSSGDIRNAFTAGKLVFSRDWPTYIVKFAEAKEDGTIPEEWELGYGLLPHAEGEESAHTLGGWGIMVSEFSKHKEEAELFARFRSSYEIQKEQALQLGQFPTRVALYEDEEVIAKVPELEILKENMILTRPRPRTPYYTEVSAAIQQGVQLLFKNDVTPEETLEYIDSNINKVIK